MGTGPKHGEAITTRALFQQAIARKTRHAKARQTAHLLSRISEWLKLFVKPAEQLERSCKWGVMLRRIFEDLGGFAFQSEPRKGALTIVNCRFFHRLKRDSDIDATKC